MMRAIGFFIILVAVAVAAIPATETNEPPSKGTGKDNLVGGLLGIIKNIPSLKASLEKSGLTFDEIDLLFGQKDLFGKMINNVERLCPVCKSVLDSAGQMNVELRIVLALAKGKAPSLFDLFKLASAKPENMFDSVVKAYDTNAYAQLIDHKAKGPNPNMTEIFQLMTGHKIDSNAVLDNEKYASGTKTTKKNRHIYELWRFVGLNWRPMSQSLRYLANLPPNFRKILHTLLTLDFSPFKFTIDNDLKLSTKKYMVANNKKVKAKYTSSAPGDLDPVKDEDIIHQIHEYRVEYPAMADLFNGPKGESAAKKAVIHLIEESMDMFNRLLS